MGSLSEFHWAIRSVLRSTTVILMSGHLSAITLHVGPPTYPAPMQHIFEITISFTPKNTSAPNSDTDHVPYSVTNCVQQASLLITL
uniref:Putative secreted protein n=1 Tax=Anopheles marajoara TaxID=58244 RepID=A0A2M4CAU7_9DIPT